MPQGRHHDECSNRVWPLLIIVVLGTEESSDLDGWEAGQNMLKTAGPADNMGTC